MQVLDVTDDAATYEAEIAARRIGALQARTGWPPSVTSFLRAHRNLREAYPDVPEFNLREAWRDGYITARARTWGRVHGFFNRGARRSTRRLMGSMDGLICRRATWVACWEAL